MSKIHFTRKNWIAVSIVVLLCMVMVFMGMCVDAKNSMVSSKNPIYLFMTNALLLPSIDAGLNAWFLLILFAIYLILFTLAFIIEMRLTKFKTKKVWTKKSSIIYVVTLFICVVLWIGFSMISQIPITASKLQTSFLFFGETLLATLIFGGILGIIIFAICSIWVNLKNIDKPYRFFGDYGNKQYIKSVSDELDEEIEDANQKSLVSMLDDKLEKLPQTSIVTGGNSQGGNSSGNIVTNVGSESSEVALGSKEYVFPGLSTIDNEEEYQDTFESNLELNLSEIVQRFRNYLADKEKLYYDIDTLRIFIAGLASSRFIILEGLSGTGKSSLARYFSNFIQEESFFTPVQSSWRDRTSILGYFNDFSKRYSETEFLKRLYRMTYRQNHVNIMVLDEMNISRVEYYFADFLSIMEYPKDKWDLKIMQLPYDFNAPTHLLDGVIKIPENTWFIGTANKDDSTYTITDKVYDRAITISFDDRNTPFHVEGNSEPISLSYNNLNRLFEEAKANEKNRMNDSDYKDFYLLTDYVKDNFDLTFGNRVLNQIENFVPVYIALGGTKYSALDFFFSRKVISKLNGRFEEYIKEGLKGLLELINKTYGKEEFPLTRKEIANILRKF